MTQGEVIKRIIKSRGLSNAEVARIAGIERMYITNITQGTLKGGKKYDALLKALNVPNQIIMFKTLVVENIEDPAQKTLMEKIYAGMIAELDIVFNCKID